MGRAFKDLPPIEWGAAPLDPDKVIELTYYYFVGQDGKFRRCFTNPDIIVREHGQSLPRSK